MRHSAVPSDHTLQWASGEQQVEPFLRFSTFSSSTATSPTFLLLLPLEGVLRLQLEAEGGVDDDDTPGRQRQEVRSVNASQFGVSMHVTLLTQLNTGILA